MREAGFVLRLAVGAGGRSRKCFQLEWRSSIVSHIVQIQTEVRDPVAIRAACGRLSLGDPVWGEARLFSRSVTGWAVGLPGWRYPVVCDVAPAKIA